MLKKYRKIYSEIMANEDNDKNNIKSEIDKKDNDEKTEDDVDNEMCEFQRCDGSCDTICVVKEMVVGECCHIYCEKCYAGLNKESHTPETCKIIKQCDGGVLSKIESETSSTECNVNNCDTPVLNSEGRALTPDGKERSSKTAKPGNNKKDRQWYSFSYKEKPVALFISLNATFNELIRRLAVMISANLDTHQIILKVQPNSSSSSADHEPFEPTPISVPNLDVKLADLHVPKSKMWIVEVVEKPTKPSESHSDTTLKDGIESERM